MSPQKNNLFSFATIKDNEQKTIDDVHDNVQAWQSNLEPDNGIAQIFGPVVPEEDVPDNYAPDSPPYNPERPQSTPPCQPLFPPQIIGGGFELKQEEEDLNPLSDNIYGDEQ